MGSFYECKCPNCNYLTHFSLGIGMSYPETKRELVIFECTHCKDYFSQNINLKRNRCPSCKRKPQRIQYDDVETLYCPKCGFENLEVVGLGMWD